MTDEFDVFDEIAKPDFLLKAVEEAGAKGAYRGAATATQHLLKACQEIERQVKAKDRSTEILRRQEKALKEASEALSMAQLRQIAAVVVFGSIFIVAACGGFHFVLKEPREVPYGCTKWEGSKCTNWTKLKYAE